MEKLKNYIYGQWVEGTGNGIPLYNAVKESRLPFPIQKV
jgi:hypothetical protein